MIAAWLGFFTTEAPRHGEEQFLPRRRGDAENALAEARNRLSFMPCLIGKSKFTTAIFLHLTRYIPVILPSKKIGRWKYGCARCNRNNMPYATSISKQAIPGAPMEKSSRTNLPRRAGYSIA